MVTQIAFATSIQLHDSMMMTKRVVRVTGSNKRNSAAVVLKKLFFTNTVFLEATTHTKNVFIGKVDLKIEDSKPKYSWMK